MACSFFKKSVLSRTSKFYNCFTIIVSIDCEYLCSQQFMFLAPAVLAQPWALEVGSVSEKVSECVRGQFSFLNSFGLNYK